MNEEQKYHLSMCNEAHCENDAHYFKDNFLIKNNVDLVRKVFFKKVRSVDHIRSDFDDSPYYEVDRFIIRPPFEEKKTWNIEVSHEIPSTRYSPPDVDIQEIEEDFKSLNDCIQWIWIEMAKSELDVIFESLQYDQMLEDEKLLECAQKDGIMAKSKA